SRCRHTESAHQHRHGTIQTPVTGGTKGMTNQSGNDDKQLADQRSQQKDERECRLHRGQG
ncbi:hypothetical protein MLM04_24205, partial [Escherichia coli]|nr:hypothetical protein [Escherichia coli]